MSVSVRTLITGIAVRELEIFNTQSYAVFDLVGILNSDGSISNLSSIKRLSEVAVAYAKAGMAPTSPLTKTVT